MVVSRSPVGSKNEMKTNRGWRWWAGAQTLESIGLVHGIHKKFGYAEFFWRENRAVIIPRARGGRHGQ